MQNKQKILLILILIFFLTNIFAFATEENTIKVHYFGTKACISCLKTEKQVQKIIEKIEAENSTIKIEFIYHFS